MNDNRQKIKLRDSFNAAWGLSKPTFDVNLPKWPGVFLTGKTVTPEQAKEIIFRTEGAFDYPSDWAFGNYREFGEKAMSYLGWDNLTKLNAQGKPENDYDLGRKWAEKMGHIDTAYVYNRWFASSYAFGPTGWLNPHDGTIHFEGHNYGKWPSVDEVRDDFEALVAAFPYLELTCTLFDGEACETDRELKALVTFVVKDGKVSVCEPDLSLHGDVKPNHVAGTMDMSHMLAMLGPRVYTADDLGWPRGWFAEFASLSRTAVQQVLIENSNVPAPE